MDFVPKMHSVERRQLYLLYVLCHEPFINICASFTLVRFHEYDTFMLEKLFWVELDFLRRIFIIPKFDAIQRLHLTDVIRIIMLETNHFVKMNNLHSYRRHIQFNDYSYYSVLYCEFLHQRWFEIVVVFLLNWIFITCNPY